MKETICQSCGIPIESEKHFGTNENGSENHDYCKYCYKDGKFVFEVSLVEYIEMNVLYSPLPDKTPEETRQYYSELLPKLKRWKGESKAITFFKSLFGKK